MLSVEHVAWQVQDPVAVADWYVAHLGFKILRRTDDAAQTHFIADASGRAIVEIYNNSKAIVPNYASQDPLLLHLAFRTTNPVESRDALIKAGATIAEDLRTTPSGDQLIMLRDPWGFAIQLCKRAVPMG